MIHKSKFNSMTGARNRKITKLDRESGVQQKDTTRLSIIRDIKYADSKLIDKARDELLKARDKIADLFPNEKGQLSLFMDEPEQFKDMIEDDDEKIPAYMAKEIIREARSHFTDEQQIGYSLDEENKAIKIVPETQKSNARDEIADYKK